MALKNVERNAPSFWIKDTRGYRSVTLTFATVSFIITSLAYLVSIFDKIGPVSFKSFDVGACSSYFGTIMALYWGRKWTEAKYSGNSAKPPVMSAGVKNENK